MSWDDVIRLLQEPWFLKTLAAAALFFGVLLFTRRLRRVAAELERRKALADYVRGLDEFLRGDFRAAIETLERVLERDPENVEARIALGDCYRETGDAAEAKKHHHHVHRVFGNELARNFLSLGKDELALGHFDLAVQAFEKSLELAPRERDTIWALALAYAEGGNALAAADAIRNLYPDGPRPDLPVARRREAARLLAEAARALLDEHKPEPAIRFYTEALAFHPNDLRARAGLLRAAHQLGDEARAKELVAEHLAELRNLTRDADVLFEPVAAANGNAEGPGEPVAAGRHLPARLEDLGGLVVAVEQRTARYACRACDARTRTYEPVCTQCGAVGTIEALPALHAAYTMPLRDHAGAAEEVEESAAFVQSLAHKASLGDEEALARLLAIGPNAIYDVFAGLPAIEARRYLGARMASLGADAAREVEACLQANAGRAQEEFATGFQLGVDGDVTTSHAALAGALADPRLDPALRDRAQSLLAARRAPLSALVDAIASHGDPESARRAAALVRDAEGVAELERRYLQAKLLGKLFGARQARRRAAADILAATGLPAAAEALGRAAAREKDEALRAHYAAAKTRAETGGAA